MKLGLMLDLETLDTKPTGVFMQAAVIVFEL